MISQLPELENPAWLQNISGTSINNEPFPLQDILKDSLYYPSSGFDGRPVMHLSGNLLSFIYVDYGYTYNEFMDSLNKGFLGYELLAGRKVSKQELAPCGCRPPSLTFQDGDPSQYIKFGWIKEPFCYWSIFQRQDGYSASHGPSRFSLLFLCADGAAAYQALYVANAAVPKAVAIIQPGHAFGFNWTDFTDPNKILARTVFNNPIGMPEFLFYGGIGKQKWYSEPCWPVFQNPVCYVGGGFGIWSRNAHNSILLLSLQPITIPVLTNGNHLPRWMERT